MISSLMRQKFLEFFKNKGHTIVASSPVVPIEDPSLLFINAGMNQFKDVFLGKNVREYSTATTSQKCIRVGGKHNDLENVGHTSRHLTFFEMLGNFSFGDYFKAQAIAYAWELTLNVFEFDAKRLWATIFHEDEESFELWKTYLPEERIIRMGEKDNFWAMGDSGPCGPCSELYFDRGVHYSHARSPAEDIEGERFLEFWNLVFMEFNRTTHGEMLRLPQQSVDTGAGLERIVSLKMGVESLFETDILRELIAQVENVSGKQYETVEKPAPFRVIADHIRTLSFAITDGVEPSNIERGYILRKVLRRAVRYGRLLGMDQPFLAAIVPRLITCMGEDYPELILSQNRIQEILTREEEAFHRTLKRGGNILNQILVNAKANTLISGEEAFKLKDTYGLPLEEILLLAKDLHLSIDLQRFEQLEYEAKERSRSARQVMDHSIEASTYRSFFEKYGPSEFVGYNQLTTESVVLALLRDDTPVSVLYEGETGVVLLDRTPFYSEKGGQIGDQGTFSSQTGLFEVMDCQSAFADLIVHIGAVVNGELHVGERVTAAVDSLQRKQIANNHTATHLLNWALRQVVGTHVKQAGSVVDSSKLRFDFNHHKALTKEEIEKIEDLVNDKIRENVSVKVYELDYTDAQKRQDILQFFGEKYGKRVRVVDIDFSKELCGGTHAHYSGTIGYFRISKEGSIAAGVRRIEACTGNSAEKSVREGKEHLEAVIFQMTQDKKSLSQEIAKYQKKILDYEIENILMQRSQIHDHPFLAYAMTLNSDALKECAESIMKRESSLILILIGIEENKCTVLVRITPDLINLGLKAVDLLKEISPLLDGKGGGKADAAQGGGTNLKNIPVAFQHARTWIEKKII